MWALGRSEQILRRGIITHIAFTTTQTQGTKLLHAYSQMHSHRHSENPAHMIPGGSEHMSPNTTRTGRAQRGRKLGFTYRAMKRRRKAARWILGCRKVDTIGHTRLQHCVAVLLRKWIRRVRPTFLNRGSGDRAPLVSCVL